MHFSAVVGVSEHCEVDTQVQLTVVVKRYFTDGTDDVDLKQGTFHNIYIGVQNVKISNYPGLRSLLIL